MVKIKRNLREEVIELLKDEDRVSTSFISHHLNVNYHRVLITLQDLEKENLVSSKETLKGRFWRLKE